jgi:dipeptidyl aminopeptidase/acylaminoacyl peptidase
VAIALIAAGAPAAVHSQVQKAVVGAGSANYQLAARFAPYKFRDLLKSTTVTPRWIQRSDRFWYEWETSSGKTFWLVDPARGTKQQIFDNDRIAAELTRITRDPWDGQHLPIRNIRFIGANTLQFEVESSQDEEVKVEETDTLQQEDRQRPARPRTKKKVFYFDYDVATRTLRLLDDYEAPNNHPSWATVSPDTSWVVFSREFNLWAMSWQEYQKVLDARRGKTGAEADSAEWKLEGLEEIQLTTDGEKNYAYGNQGRGQHDEETEKEFKRRQRAGITWSHDARWFAFTRQDRRKVGDLWVVHVVGNKRPQLESYKYDMPGEENVTQTELLVYDMRDRAMKKIDDVPWKDQTMGVYTDPTLRGGFGPPDPDRIPMSRWLSDRSDELYFFRASRNLHRIDVMVVDPASGQVRVVIEERLNTYQEQQAPWRLANGDLVWWSERDGWAHLYRFAPDGTLRRRLTEGPWHVDAIEGVDEARGIVLFTANAREPGEDPYYRHVYRVGLDGAGLQNLTPGNFDHSASVAESSRYFVNNYSRVNTVPAAALFDAAGRKILELEEADVSLLLAAGYQFPEPYTVKAADGVTDLYGVMYKPFDFDPSKRYPIIQYVYPGPQTESVAKAFSTAPFETGLAQFGFIVVTVGNRGGHPDRSKWYHNYGYGNLRDYGLADKKVAAEQLAQRHPFIDIERVGIYGHSGGGFMSTAAMLVYPDFFKVAVSSAGNHENNIYNRWWSETHHGVKEVTNDKGEVSFEYDIRKNSELAANLKGRLLLTTGDVDNNVHHAGTFRMAEALIRANKRFDFFIFPGQRHGFGDMSDYWYWLRAEYFVKHLLGDWRWNVDMIELQGERPKTR